jgi:hypothetical protein
MCKWSAACRWSDSPSGVRAPRVRPEPAPLEPAVLVVPVRLTKCVTDDWLESGEKPPPWWGMATLNAPEPDLGQGKGRRIVGHQRWRRAQAAWFVWQGRPDPEVLARLAGYRASATRVGRHRVT